MRGLDLSYFLRRIGMFFLVVFVAATFNFFIPRLAPGNPIGAITSRMASASSGIENGKEMFDAYRTRFGLDQPMYIQYAKYMWNTAHLDFGQSLSAYPADVIGHHPAGHRLVDGPDRRQRAPDVRVRRNDRRAAGVEGHTRHGESGPPDHHDRGRAALLPAGHAAALCLCVHHPRLAHERRLRQRHPEWTELAIHQHRARHAILPALSIILTSVGGVCADHARIDGQHDWRRLHAAGGCQGSAEMAHSVVVRRAQRDPARS